MTDDGIVPNDPYRLRENKIDLEMAISDSMARLDPSDPIAVAELAELSALYRDHVVALRRSRALETADAR